MRITVGERPYADSAKKRWQEIASNSRSSAGELRALCASPARRAETCRRLSAINPATLPPSRHSQNDDAIVVRPGPGSAAMETSDRNDVRDHRRLAAHLGRAVAVGISDGNGVRDRRPAHRVLDGECRWKHLTGTAFVIAKNHSQALTNSGQRQFDVLPRSAADALDPRTHPSYESRVGAGHVAQGV